jgi:hypothetical protein
MARGVRPRPPVKWTSEEEDVAEGGREKKTGRSWSRAIVWLERGKWLVGRKR